MLGWMNEKLKTAKDQSYLDPTNIRGKLQKHANFEQELRANRNRLDEIKATGQELVLAGHFANEHVQSRLAEVEDLWAQLVEASALKGAKLQEANQASRTFFVKLEGKGILRYLLKIWIHTYELMDIKNFIYSSLKSMNPLF
jgi:hypothetical protein